MCPDPGHGFTVRPELELMEREENTQGLPRANVRDNQVRKRKQGKIEASLASHMRYICAPLDRQTMGTSPARPVTQDDPSLPTSIFELRPSAVTTGDKVR